MSRRDQRRLILLIFGVGGLILLVDVMRDPGAWLPGSAEPDGMLPAAINASADADPNADVASRGVASNTGLMPSNDTGDSGQVSEGNAEAADPTSSDDAIGPLGLSQAIYEVVEDNTVGLSRAEGIAYHDVLLALKEIRNSTLSRVARRDVTYSVLMADPEQYRGELVAFDGLLRRLTPFPIANDVEGIDQLLEGWFFTEDSDIQPYRLVMLDADEQIPRGDSIEPMPLTVVGVFFKRQAYASNAGTSVAPLLLVKKLRYVPPPATEPNDQLTPILTVTICVAMSAIFLAFLRTLRRQSRRRVEFRVAASHHEGPGDVECEPPAEFLAMLAREDESAAEREAETTGEL